MTLKPCETYELSKINTPADYQAVANSSDALEGIEQCMAVWLKQLEQVLAESEQMRKEADDIGPRAELDHWKKRMSKFNYLLDQIKGSDVKAVLGVLHAAKSKLVAVSGVTFITFVVLFMSLTRFKKILLDYSSLSFQTYKLCSLIARKVEDANFAMKKC